jgi:calcium-dependent protein kinase
MPFQGATSAQIIANVEAHALTSKPAQWTHVSEECRDLVTKLLDPDPQMRPTAAEALEHPWLDAVDGAAGTASSLPPSVTDGLSRFQKLRVIERAALKALLPLVASKRHEEARAMFHSLDKDGNGVLSFDEFVAGMQILVPATFGRLQRGEEGDAAADAAARQLFDAIDSEPADGSIDIEEWLNAALQVSAFELRHAASVAFASLDVNQDGHVDAEELISTLDGVSGLSLTSEEEAQLTAGQLRLPDIEQLLLKRIKH